MSFEHDRNLPWGWWLLRSDSEYEDERGRAWRSVREAFWHGRLGFPRTPFIEAQQELVLRVMLSIEYRTRPHAERAFELFGGNEVTERFYVGWLASAGLLDSGDPQDRDGWLRSDDKLSAEGHAAMLMLQATREPAWMHLPASQLLDAIAEAARDGADVARERALRAFEASVRQLPYVFERARIGRGHVITLAGLLVDARMPTRSRMWSLSFGEARARDDLFAFLAERVASWEAWGRLAYYRGSSALTDHLLTLLVAAARPTS